MHIAICRLRKAFDYEALAYDGKNVKDICNFVGEGNYIITTSGVHIIATDLGEAKVNKNDFVVKDTKTGELYLLDEYSFRDKYTVVSMRIGGN